MFTFGNDNIIVTSHLNALVLHCDVKPVDTTIRNGCFNIAGTSRSYFLSLFSRKYVAWHCDCARKYLRKHDRGVCSTGLDAHVNRLFANNSGALGKKNASRYKCRRSSDRENFSQLQILDPILGILSSRGRHESNACLWRDNKSNCDRDKRY